MKRKILSLMLSVSLLLTNVLPAYGKSVEINPPDATSEITDLVASDTSLDVELKDNSISEVHTEQPTEFTTEVVSETVPISDNGDSDITTISDSSETLDENVTTESTVEETTQQQTVNNTTQQETNTPAISTDNISEETTKETYKETQSVTNSQEQQEQETETEIPSTDSEVISGSALDTVTDSSDEDQDDVEVVVPDDMLEDEYYSEDENYGIMLAISNDWDYDEYLIEQITNVSELNDTYLYASKMKTYLNSNKLHYARLLEHQYVSGTYSNPALYALNFNDADKIMTLMIQGNSNTMFKSYMDSNNDEIPYWRKLYLDITSDDSSWSFSHKGAASQTNSTTYDVVTLHDVTAAGYWAFEIPYVQVASRNLEDTSKPIIEDNGNSYILNIHSGYEDLNPIFNISYKLYKYESIQNGLPRLKCALVFVPYDNNDNIITDDNPIYNDLVDDNTYSVILEPSNSSKYTINKNTLKGWANSVYSDTGKRVSYYRAALMPYFTDDFNNKHYLVLGAQSDKITLQQSQTISGSSSFTKTYGDGSFSLGQSASTTLSYSSSNSSVASVNSSGTVTINGAGTAIITVTAAETTSYQSATKTVTITVNKASNSISGGSTFYSKQTIDSSFSLNKSAKGGTLSYTSNNTSVATVSSNGIVSPVGSGTATITVSTLGDNNYGSVSQTVTITVSEVTNTITFTNKPTSLTYGDTGTYKGRVVKGGLGPNDISWQSSNSSILSISDTGEYNALGVGTVTVTAKSLSGSGYTGVSQSFTVTVNKANQTISGSSSFTKTYGDGSFSLGQSYNGVATYTSSNTSIAAVNSNGTVTINGAGDATITITVVSDFYNTTPKDVSIKVNKRTNSITVNTPPPTTITYGDSGTVKGTAIYGNVTYSSSNASVININSGTGAWEAVGAGSTIIYITSIDDSNNTSTTEQFTRNVGKASQSITGADNFYSDYKDPSFNLNQTCIAGTLTYSSSDTDVATVDNSGNVTPINAGTATITISTTGNNNYNGATKTVTVEVCQIDATAYGKFIDDGNQTGDSLDITVYVGDTLKISDYISGTDAGSALYFHDCSDGDNWVIAGDTITFTKYSNGDECNVELHSTEIRNYCDTLLVDFYITIEKRPNEVSTEDIEIYYLDYNSINPYTTVVTNNKTDLIYSDYDSSIIEVTSDGKIIPKAVGTTTLKVTSKETDEYFSASKTINVIIKNKSNSIISVDSLEFDYGDTSTKSLNATATSNVLSYEVISGTDVVSVDISGNVTALNAGTATIKITSEEYGWDTATKEVPVVVNKIENTISEITGLPSEITFGDVNFTLSTSCIEGVVTYSTTSDKINVNSTTGEVEILGASPSDDVIITIISPETRNYSSTTKSISFKISKKLNSISIDYSSIPTNLRFDSEPFTISANSLDGSITFSTEDTEYINIDENTGLVTIKKASPTSNITVKITSSETANYSSTSEVVTFTISKIDANIGVEDITFDLVDLQKDVTYTVNSTGSISYTAYDDTLISITGNTVKAKRVGSTKVTLVVAEDDNYNETTKDFNVTINKSQPILNVTKDSYTVNYGTESEKLQFEVVGLIEGLDSTGKVQITSSDNEVVSISEAEGNFYLDYHNVGTAVLTITVPEDDNYLEITGTANVEIDIINNPIITDKEVYELVYGETDAINVSRYFDIDDTGRYEQYKGTYKFTSSNPSVVSIDNYGVITPLQATVDGDVIITITCDNTRNYLSDTKTVTVSVARANPSLEVTGNIIDNRLTLDYLGEDDILNISTVSDAQYVSNLINPIDKQVANMVDNGLGNLTISPVNAGAATLTISVPETNKYTSDSISIDVIVNKIEPTYTYNDPTNKLVYGGTFDLGFETVGGTITYGYVETEDLDTADITISDSGIILSLASSIVDTNKLIVNIAESDNYTELNGIEIPIFVNKADLSINTDTDLVFNIRDISTDLVSTVDGLQFEDTLEPKYTSTDSNLVVTENGNVKFLNTVNNAIVNATYAEDSRNYNSISEDINITVNPTDLKLSVDGSYSIDYLSKPVTVEPTISDLVNNVPTNGTFRFVSTNEDIFTVDNKGNVTSVNAGTAKLEIYFENDNNYNNTCVTTEIIINPVNPKVTYTVPSNKVYGDDDFTLNVLTSNTDINDINDIMSIDVVEGDDVVSITTDNLIHILSAGKAKLHITLSNTRNYNSYSFDAYVTIHKANTKLECKDVVLTYGTSYPLDLVYPSDVNADVNIEVLDTTIALYKDGNIYGNKAGSTTLTISFSGNNYEDKVIVVDVTINPRKDITIILDNYEYIYNFTAIEPMVTISSNLGTLIEGTDYTLKYYNNTSVGQGIVEVTGINNYAGTFETYFDITSLEAYTIAKATENYMNSTHSITYNVMYGDELLIDCSGILKYTILNSITDEVYTTSNVDVVDGTASFIINNLPTGKYTIESEFISNGDVVVKSTPITITSKLNIDTTGDGQPNINIDTDNDGIPDINIDIDNDGTPDINIDTDGDNLPNINIDTDGDGKADLNIDIDGDNLPDLNIDITGNGQPDLNIDTDGDNIPDLNVDTDGDGKADLNIDTDGDGKPNINIDTTGDGKADTNIDADGDGIVDKIEDDTTEIPSESTTETTTKKPSSGGSSSNASSNKTPSSTDSSTENDSSESGSTSVKDNTVNGEFSTIDSTGSTSASTSDISAITDNAVVSTETDTGKVSVTVSDTNIDSGAGNTVELTGTNINNYVVVANDAGQQHYVTTGSGSSSDTIKYDALEDINDYELLSVEDYRVLALTINSDIMYDNGEECLLDVTPIIIDNRTFVPIRYVSEHLGASVEWIAETKTAIITDSDNGYSFSVTVGDNAEINGIIQNNRLLLPLRYVSEELQSAVSWYQKTRTVTIISEQ